MLFTTRFAWRLFARRGACEKTFLSNSCFVLIQFVYLKRRGGEKREREKEYVINNNIIILFKRINNYKVLMKNKNLYQEKINRLESQIKKIEYSVATLNRDQAYQDLDKAREILRDMQTMLNREEEYFKA